MSSSPNESQSQYICHQCGQTNTSSSRCMECQSDAVEETVPRTTDHEQPSSENTDALSSTVIREFNLESLANMFFISPMAPARHRRTRTSRRIKRATPTHRSLFMPSLRLFNLNDAFLRQTVPMNWTLVQMPFPFLIIDGQRDALRLEWPEDNASLPLTRNEIDQLTSISMTPSNLSVYSSCAICLEPFDSDSDVKQLPQCHHVFHRLCLTEWLLHHGQCPMCRSLVLNRSTPVPNNNPESQGQSQQQPQLPHFNATMDDDLD